MRDCESCVYARPYGGENDNRCSAWSCEYINRTKAIKIYEAYKNIVRCGECRKWREEDGERFCGISELICSADDFCSYGERRADE